MSRRDARWLGTSLLGAVLLLGCDESAPRTEGFDVPEPTAGTGGIGAIGGGSTGASHGGVAQTHALVSSDWMMQGFEDPVAISLGRHIGCFTWLPVYGGSEDDCGTLRSLGGEGRRMTFAMTFNGFGSGLVTYAADVYQSQDGTRMAGRFISFSARTGDVPLPPADTWPLGYAWFPLINSNQSGGKQLLPFSRRLDELPVPERAVALRLDETEPSGGELERQKDYWFALRDTGRGISLVGDLGAYFDTEISWDAATQTLLAGPVAETFPGYPIALAISYVDGRVQGALAGTASGGRYHLLRVETPTP